MPPARNYRIGGADILNRLCVRQSLALIDADKVHGTHIDQKT